MFKSSLGTYTAQIPSHSTAWSFWQRHAPKLCRKKREKDKVISRQLKLPSRWLRVPISVSGVSTNDVKIWQKKNNCLIVFCSGEKWKYQRLASKYHDVKILNLKITARMGKLCFLSCSTLSLPFLYSEEIICSSFKAN